MATSLRLTLLLPILALLTFDLTAAHPPSEGHSSDDSMGGMPRRCRSERPFNSSYQAVGIMTKLGDLDVYETGAADSERLLVVAYDIFGYHPNTFMNADLIAAEGKFRVVIPDYFKGKPWPLEKLPAAKDDLFKFLSTTGSWDVNAREITKNVLAHYKKEAKQIAFYGTCWGGKTAFLAAVEFGSDIRAAATIHGFNHTKEEMGAVKVPGYLIPARGDPDMSEMYEVLKSRFGDKAGHTRMTDVEHGYYAARGNLTDPTDVKRINETRHILIKFFNENMM